MQDLQAELKQAQADLKQLKQLIQEQKSKYIKAIKQLQEQKKDLEEKHKAALEAAGATGACTVMHAAKFYLLHLLVRLVSEFICFNNSSCLAFGEPTLSMLR